MRIKEIPRLARQLAGFVGLALFSLASTSFALAAPFPEDQCAIIIASRPTLAEAHAWALSTGYKVDVIYSASNGYFAVSAGIIPKAGWRDRISALKAAGVVPYDAYCSGRGMVSVAAFGPADAEDKIRKLESERAIALAEAARARAEREAEEAKARAILAEERALSVEEKIGTPAGEDDSIDTTDAKRDNFPDSRSDDRRETTLPDTEVGSVRSFGTGFRISQAGIMITNNHVIKDCETVTADGVPVEVKQSSSTFDLAVLVPSGKEELSRPWLSLSSEPPRLNADIAVAGYPLHGLLGGINVTRGTITSLRGLGGDDSSMQISAPIQNGNSGGAVVDRYGRVVGVVFSKLDSDALKAVTGVSAENVNFSVRGDILRLMLDRYEIDYDRTDKRDEMSPEDLADRLIAATSLVECR